MDLAKITDVEFGKFKSFIYEKAGISMSDAKKSLVLTRLNKRLRHHNISTFSKYYDFIHSDEHQDELQIVIDLLTTNETYFFREPKHFDFLENLLPDFSAATKPTRIWSAASSSGEEAYSIAMTMADKLGFNRKWEIIGTDISSRVVDRAREGLYPLNEKNQIPTKYLREYCLKGVRAQAGKILIDDKLKERVNFSSINLNSNYWPDVGLFDVIFLRNVMIYFDNETKRQLINKMWAKLNPGGYLLIGHSESLNGISDRYKAVRPATYQRIE